MHLVRFEKKRVIRLENSEESSSSFDSDNSLESFDSGLTQSDIDHLSEYSKNDKYDHNIDIRDQMAIRLIKTLGLSRNKRQMLIKQY